MSSSWAEILQRVSAWDGESHGSIGFWKGKHLEEWVCDALLSFLLDLLCQN